MKDSFNSFRFLFKLKLILLSSFKIKNRLNIILFHQKRISINKKNTFFNLIINEKEFHYSIPSGESLLSQIIWSNSKARLSSIQILLTLIEWSFKYRILPQISSPFIQVKKSFGSMIREEKTGK